jgi:hypothetical protein
LLSPFFLRGPIQRFKTDLSDQLYKFRFFFFGLGGDDLDRFQLFGADTLSVQLFDLFYPIDRERILFIAVGQRVPHQIFENIFFDQERISLCYLQYITVIRKMLQRIQIRIEFIIQTTFKSSALSTQLGLIDR